MSASSEVMLSEAVAEHPLDADSGAALRARQVQLLYDQSLTSLGGSLVAAVTLVLVFWGATSPHVLFSWLAVAVGITLARFFVTLSYRRSPAQVARANVWGGWFVVGTAASGLVWGAGSFMLVPPDSPVYESFYLLWVGGMTGATVATYSVVPAAFIAFSVPALIPPTLYFLSRGDQFHVTVGSVILIFLAFVWISSWRVHKSLVRALELQFENDRLIAYLDREKDRAESLNERLKADIEERKRVERELRRAMEQSQGLARQLRQLSAEDALTGIGNRRRFDEAFEREWSRAMRGHYSISLIMCDLDFFKAYNDHYGHTAGDECLKRVGAVLEQHCRRPGDLAARYGGEEFVVLLPRADAEDARSMAEKIRRAVEDLAMPHAASDVGSMVTTTVGVATLIPDRDMSPKHFLEMADAALYAGKREGRNRVVVSEYLD